MVVENDCDAGGLQLAQTSLLEVETICQFLTTIKIWEANQLQHSSFGIKFGVPIYQRFNDPISQLNKSGNKSVVIITR